MAAPPLTVAVQAIEVLSYALAHNRIPVVGQILLDAVTVSVRGADVRVSVHDAQGELSQPCHVAVDLEAGQQTRLRDLTLTLDPGQMSQVEEQRPGEILIEVVAGDGAGDWAASGAPGLLGSARVPVQILAANQWLRTGAAVTDEVLAAFVQPNHPAVGRLLLEAATILGQRTPSGSLDGYAGGEQRVDDLVQAVVRAVEGRRSATPSRPPAGPTRPEGPHPEEVLEARSAPASTPPSPWPRPWSRPGSGPVLWVDGHAFLGYWRAETALDAVVLRPTRPRSSTGSTSARCGWSRPPCSRRTAACRRSSSYGGRVRGLAERDACGARDRRRLATPGRTASSRCPRAAAARTASRSFEYSPAVRPHADPVAGPARPVPAAEPRPRAHPGAAVEERPARPQPAQPADQLHRARRHRARRARRPARARLEDLLSAGRPVQLLPTDQLDAIHGGRGRRRRAELPPDPSRELLDPGSRSTATCPRRPTPPGCATWPTRPAPSSRRPAPTTSTSPSGRWSGAWTRGRCGPR